MNTCLKFILFIFVIIIAFCFLTYLQNYNFIPRVGGNLTYKQEDLIRDILNEYVRDGKFEPIAGDAAAEKIKLATPDGTALSLDGYNAALNVGYEYQGPFHYRCVNCTTKGDFYDYLVKRYNDDFKANSLKGRLIIIPYTVYEKYSGHELTSYVKSRLYDLHILRDPQAFIESNQYIAEMAEPSRDFDELIKSIVYIERLPGISTKKILFKNGYKLMYIDGRMSLLDASDISQQLPEQHYDIFINNSVVPTQYHMSMPEVTKPPTISELLSRSPEKKLLFSFDQNVPQAKEISLASKLLDKSPKKKLLFTLD